MYLVARQYYGHSAQQESESGYNLLVDLQLNKMIPCPPETQMPEDHLLDKDVLHKALSKLKILYVFSGLEMT